MLRSHHLEENQNTDLPPQPPSLEVNESSAPTPPETSLPVPVEAKEATATDSQLETQNSKPETDSMEVHKHPHHVMHKKKWSEYLLEFLMLFLAVFLGFIAENIRESQVEKQRAKEYMLSFYEDLENDTTRINALISYDKQKVGALVTMYNCYDTVSANLLATACMGRLIKYSRSNKGLVLTQRTVQQLANAGGYRLLHKEDADSVAAYENAYKAYLDFQSTVFQTAQDNVRNTLNRLADFRVVAPFQLTTASFSGDSVDVEPAGPLLISKDRLLINQWFNELSLYLRTINGQLTIMLQLKTRATGLLKFYNSKYHF